MTDKDPYLVPGLLRGLAILQLFSPQHPELTLSQLVMGSGSAVRRPFGRFIRWFKRAIF